MNSRTTVTNNSTKEAAKTWDQMDIKVTRDVAWMSIKIISRSIQAAFSGKDKIPSLVHQEMLNASPQINRLKKLTGLALVCGDMEAERPFFEPSKKVSFSVVEGLDLSKVSLKRYRKIKGITFKPKVKDCNNMVLKRSSFDLAVACHGAHHIFNLGNFFYQANKSLKKNGLMYIYEWIGPEKLQIPFSNHVIATLLLWLLFSKKQRTTHMGAVKGRWVQYGPDSWDPSEACNSTELWPQFVKYFNPIKTSFHGGLTYPIFEGIAQNLDQDDRTTQLKVRLILLLERLFTKVGFVKPLFVISVARKRFEVE